MTWLFLFGGKHLPLWAFPLRALVLYLALVAATRWMGHRQVGILSGHNYLTAAGIVSLASLRMVNAESSLIAGLVIVGIYAAANVLLSKLDLRWPLAIDREPITLIAGGQLLLANLRKARVTVQELLALLRLGDCPRLSDAWYAVLEPTGKLSIVKRAAASPVTRSQFGLGPVPVGVSLIVVREGKVDREALLRVGREERWLLDDLRRKYEVGDLSNVFLAVLEPDGSLAVTRRPSKEV